MKDTRFMKESYIKEVLEYIPKNRKIFEIGAGYGNFTFELAKISERVRAFEINDALFKLSTKKLSKMNNVILIKDDAFNYIPENDEIVFSDLPFSKSREFLSWIAKNYVWEIYAVVQSEFYEKLVSKPGSKRYTGVSVVFNILFDSKKLLEIPSDAYIPPPRVHATFFMAKRLKNCVFNEKDLNSIITYMSKHNEESMFFPKKRRFQLHPGEVLKEIGLQTC
ncbi:MAG: rRNA adenine N-6-methyltransferase family protein [Nitrososphaeria archaeon]|nr:rRNA adenine N-6-methyltransferase family protein [Conexivisphaerales archaeon]